MHLARRSRGALCAQYPDSAAFDARTGAATALAVASLRGFQRSAGGGAGAPQCAPPLLPRFTCADERKRMLRIQPALQRQGVDPWQEHVWMKSVRKSATRKLPDSCQRI